MSEKNGILPQIIFTGLIFTLLGLMTASCTDRIDPEPPTAETWVQEPPRVESDSTGAQCWELYPAELVPDIQKWLEPHLVCSPADEKLESTSLFVFLPGTGATPDYYTTLLETAAEFGVYAIGLRYPNDKSVNLQLCPLDNDAECHEKIRAETIYGEDLSPHVEVDPDNSILGRLTQALTYLKETHPDQGWGQFLDERGEPRWSSMIVSGHSQGAGHAVYLAMDHLVERAISFSWADVRRGDLAPWLTQKVSQTPPENYYLFYHTDDEPVALYQELLMDSLGIDRFGLPVTVDNSLPPYQWSHALVAVAEPLDGERAHNTHVVDRALTYDQAGNPTYQETWVFLLTGEASPDEIDSSIRADEIVVDAVRVGLPSVFYVDPEFYSLEDLVAFADGQRRVWLAELDPASGDFVSLDGRDILVDTDLTRLASSFNGPEFGWDQDGWALYYVKENAGVPQIWRAELIEDDLERTLLTKDNTIRLSALASKDRSLEETRLLFAWGGFSPFQGQVAWLSESDPAGTETMVAPIDRGARWIDNSSLLTFVRSTDIGQSQVVLYDTNSGESEVITDTPGQKSYAYGWLSPEYGQLLVMTVVDDGRIEIYQDTGGEFWEMIQVLEIPSGLDYGYIGSPEPFTAGGRSYISLVIKEDAGYAEAMAWVWGVGGQFLLRCEDGLGNVIRSDPETYVGNDEVFLYYQIIQSDAAGEGGVSLYKCPTGIAP